MRVLPGPSNVRFGCPSTQVAGAMVIVRAADEVWVTHGREDALLHHIQTTGRRGRALALIGREEEDQ